MVSSDFGRGPEHSAVIFNAQFCLIRPTQLVRYFLIGQEEDLLDEHLEDLHSGFEGDSHR